MGRHTAEFWRRKLNVGEREENRMCKAWPSFFLLCSSLTLSITFMPLKKQKWKWVWLYSLSQKSRLRRIIFLLWKREMLQIIRGNKKFTGGQELHCTCMNGKPGTLLQRKWAFALTNLVWICDIFPHKISDLHLKSAKKISKEALPNLLATELYIFICFTVPGHIIYFLHN